MGVVINVNTDRVEMRKCDRQSDVIDLSGMSKKKARKLQHYADRDATNFVQYDVFTNMGDGDSVVTPDQDGDSLFQSNTTELMTGCVAVRVLIVPGTSAETVVRALRKVASWAERSPDVLKKRDTDVKNDCPF